MAAKKYNLKDLEKTFIEMNNDKTRVGLDLLAEAYFMKDTLARLRDEIKNNDIVGEMCQGSYSINRSNPALKTYNTTIANYQKLMKQLVELLPTDKEVKPVGDGFENFGDDA